MKQKTTFIYSLLSAILSFSLVAPIVTGQQSENEKSSLVDRVGSTGFLQLQAESFKQLTQKQQALAYWLSQASIAVNPIIYDQESRFGLRHKHILEEIVAHPE